RPGYTSWMLGLWILSIAPQAVLGPLTMREMQSLMPPPPVMTSSGPVYTMNDRSGTSPFLVPSFCLLEVLGLLGLPAVVLQLMWIYRIHSDALSARAYQDISPGLALGLSFVPVVNYAWTGWTLRKLAVFVNRNATPTPGTTRAVQAATCCF